MMMRRDYEDLGHLAEPPVRRPEQSAVRRDAGMDVAQDVAEVTECDVDRNRRRRGGGGGGGGPRRRRRRRRHRAGGGGAHGRRERVVRALQDLARLFRHGAVFGVQQETPCDEPMVSPDDRRRVPSDENTATSATAVVDRIIAVIIVVRRRKIDDALLPRQ